MRGELRQQAAGGVQLRSVGSGVDDHHHRVETGTRDVVGEAVARAVGRVVMGREDQTAAYRVAGVVDGENGERVVVEYRTSASVCSSRAVPSRSGAYISSSKPRTSTRQASPSRASAIRAAMVGRADSRVVRCAGVKPCRPPSGTPAGHSSSTRVQKASVSRPGIGDPAPAAAATPPPSLASAARSWAATSACPFSRTPSGRRTVPVPLATRSTRVPISAANSVRRPRSAGDRMSTRATITYRSRGYSSCSARIVLSTVLPVENSSSTSTSGSPARPLPPPASSVGSSGSSRCEVACECDSSKPPARATPSTGRRVEWRYGATPSPSATAWPRPVAVSAYPRTTDRRDSASPRSSRTRRPSSKPAP